MRKDCNNLPGENLHMHLRAACEAVDNAKHAKVFVLEILDRHLCTHAV